ncbi:MAG TPA: 7-carboxy-7-deazaguanine synthase QueE [Limnochordia bacterium]
MATLRLGTAEGTAHETVAESETVLRVSEIFTSIQGEGLQSGYWCTFIRFQGCTVGCPWCDTKYTWDFRGGRPMRLSEIWEAARTVRLVITGGEPVQQPRRAMAALIDGLVARGHFVQVETSGRFFAPWLARVHWRTVSPKPPTYAVHPRLVPLIDELKYVVDETFTPERVLAERPAGCPVLLQPESNRPDRVARALEWLREYPEWRLSVQLHKFLDLP